MIQYQHWYCIYYPRRYTKDVQNYQMLDNIANADKQSFLILIYLHNISNAKPSGSGLGESWESHKEGHEKKW